MFFLTKLIQRFRRKIASIADRFRLSGFSWTSSENRKVPGLLEARLEAASLFRDAPKRHPNPRMTRELMALAERWKRRHLFSEGDLDALEREGIREISSSGFFFDLVADYAELQERFFTWTIQDHNDPKVFILFPKMADFFLDIGLSSRFGFYGGKHLSISPDQKELWIQVEGKWVMADQLDVSIRFSNGRVTTLREIYTTFQNKLYHAGDVELFHEGIVPWDSLHWDKILGKELEESWYERLPLLRRMTHEEAELRYQKRLFPGDSVVAAYATRSSSGLDFQGTHAFLEIAVDAADGSYRVYNFGKYAKKFPKNGFETMKMLCENAFASIAYPDENIFYSSREHGLYPFIIDQDQVKKLFASIREDFLLGLRGQFLYQIESENCAKWVSEKLKQVIALKEIPDLFFLPLLETEPEGAVGVIFRGIKRMPKSWHVPLLTFLHLFLGAFQTTYVDEDGKRRGVSLMDHEFFSHGNVFLPSLLVHKIVEEFESSFDSLVGSVILQPFEVQRFRLFFSALYVMDVDQKWRYGITLLAQKLLPLGYEFSRAFRDSFGSSKGAHPFSKVFPQAVLCS